MKRQLIHCAFLLLGLAPTISGCWNEPNFDDKPAISFKSIDPIDLPASADRRTPRRDSVIITLGFQDGTGDLGEDTRDSTRLKTVFGKETWGNYQIKTLRLVNGKYEELPLEVNAKLFFMRLTKEGQRGAIEGTLDFRQVFFYTNSSKITPVKFQIKIRDRKLQESNMIETDTVHVPILVR